MIHLCATTPARRARRFAGAMLALAVAAVLLPGGSTTGTAAAAPKETARFLAVGDTGTGTPEQFRVGRTMARTCASRGCDLVLLLGDNFYPEGVRGADDPLWAGRFERPYRGLDGPFLAVLGNHDHGRNLNRIDWHRADGQLAYARTHPRWVLPARQYRYDLGPVRILVLDTTALLLERPESTAAQAALAREALRQPAPPWLVVAGHHPYVSNGPNGSAGAYHRADRPDVDGSAIKRFFERYLCGHARLFLAGHEHNLQVLPGTAECPGLFAISGAGAMAEGFARRTGPYKGQVLAVPTHFRAARPGFALVTATAQRLVVEMIGAGGEVEYRHELRQP